jgi:2-dehydro-3-deoxyphosphooctonate aldolase (KDO 8-P synthase)
MILIAGPCVIEDFITLDQTLQGMLDVIQGKDIEFYFKASALKDNRTKTDNYRSVQTFFAGLRFLRDLGKTYNIKICTDFHTVEQVKQYSQYVDMIQIPAFLSRQVSLLEAVGDYGRDKVILIKKMQSMSPKDIQIPVNIIKNRDNKKRIIVADRGTAFGYNDLMFDPRHIPLMKGSGCETIVDITHMNKYYSRWYWERNDFAGILARSSMAAGADGLFMETHTCPSEAMCDANTQLTLDQFKKITKDLVY